MEQDDKWTGFWSDLFNKITKSSSKDELSNQFDNQREKEQDRRKVRELKRQQLEFYQSFLEKLASEGSSEMVSNGGIEYASILMSVLLKNTTDIARIYCKGFREDLITTDPYWSTLKLYLENTKHKILVLVQSANCIDEKPLQLLKKIKDERKGMGLGDSIIVKEISPKSRIEISQIYGEDCNFAVFDKDKFRYEYDPEGFKAYGSFNQPKTCEKLRAIFDKAFLDRNSSLVF